MEVATQKNDNSLQFAVITPTYKRPKLLVRCVKSTLVQLTSASKIIVINDSPKENYDDVEKILNNSKNVIYIRNKENLGKNYSVNAALDYLQKERFNGYIIFLDDDDWLAPDCLRQFSEAIFAQQYPTWLVSNRTSPTDQSFTKNKTGKRNIHYYRDYLLFKRFTGDATHCIKFRDIQNIRMPEKIRNAEEWVFFAQVARVADQFTYINSPGTYSEGYDVDGLTKIKMSRKEQLNRLLDILFEVRKKRLWSIYICTYLLLRFLRIVF